MATSTVEDYLKAILLEEERGPGQPVATGELKQAKDAVGDTPVFANTGVNIDNVAEVLKIADGCVIGSHLKVDGNTWNNIDKARVKRFMDKVRKLRK